MIISKKMLLGLGAVATIAVPTAITVSCENTSVKVLLAGQIVAGFAFDRKPKDGTKFEVFNGEKSLGKTLGIFEKDTFNKSPTKGKWVTSFAGLILKWEPKYQIFQIDENGKKVGSELSVSEIVQFLKSKN